ncbi:MAG TPA: TVP38/TMEM64 family protein [Gammaproteobacteria bacterium]|nr:TVP38/TMEM64 family protein [Gammaproteobacteria bacterium]
MTRNGWLRLGGVALLAVAIGFGISLRGRIDPSDIQRWVDGAGLWAPLFFMLGYAVSAVLFIPGTVFTLAGGALFGPIWGTLYNLTGATVGAVCAFLVARYLAADWVAAKTGGRLRRVIDGVEREGWRFVAFTRLVPVFPFNVLNYAFGLTRVPLLHYFLATFICMAPGAAAYTYIGFVGREALAGGGDLIRKGLLALALLAVAVFLPNMVKRWRRRKSRPETP